MGLIDKLKDINEMRKQLLEFAVAEQLDIVSLQTEGNNLEDIFRNLTTNQTLDDK